MPNARHGWLVDLGDGSGSVFGHGVLKGASKIYQEAYGGSKSNWLKSFFPDLQCPGPDMCKVKHSVLAMQCLAGLSDLMMEVCWQHSANL